MRRETGRDPLKLFLSNLEPNLGEAGVRRLLDEGPRPTAVAFKVKRIELTSGEAVDRAFA